jgi:hypothetical protein
MDLFSTQMEDEELSLRELAMSSTEDFEMQKSDLVLTTTLEFSQISRYSCSYSQIC